MRGPGFVRRDPVLIQQLQPGNGRDSLRRWTRYGDPHVAVPRHGPSWGWSPIEDRAWRILESHDDKAWSYVDATSFALMEHEQTNKMFAFDRDFALLIVPDAGKR